MSASRNAPAPLFIASGSRCCATWIGWIEKGWIAARG
jgi:hypothetical protein